MRGIKVQDIRPGQILSQSIKHPFSYKVLLMKGTVLTEFHMESLKKHNIEHIFVEEENEKQTKYSLAAHELYNDATQVMSNLFEDVKLGKYLDLLPVKKVVNSLINQLSNNSNYLLQLRILKQHDKGSLSHCINVSIFAILLGRVLGIKEPELLELALAAMVHDIGKVKISTSILLKPGPLTAPEFNTIKSHPLMGLNILKGNTNITERILAAVFQHHEKCDGTGYPNGIKGDAIDQWAKIIAIADIYDALTSNRSYRRRVAPDLAIDFLMQQASNAAIDYQMTQLFIKNISIYPIGAKVLLSNNKIGQVLEIPFGTPWRPTVAIGNDKICLVEQRDISILDIVS